VDLGLVVVQQLVLVVVVQEIMVLEMVEAVDPEHLFCSFPRLGHQSPPTLRVLVSQAHPTLLHSMPRMDSH
jgi:hypothetical protein